MGHESDSARMIEELGLPIERRCHCGQLAAYVASDTEGLQWFECGQHDAYDNIGGTKRVSLVPLAEWLRQIREVLIK